MKIGPATKTNSRLPSAVSLTTRVPVMSAGIRSTVNWMRLKRSASASASERTISVLPVPGTPSMSTWPPAKSPARMASITSSWPTTTRAISRRTAAKVSWKSRMAAAAISAFIADLPRRAACVRRGG